jgi:4-amino-4-deoxy-L-arabinose transferase-like glycosyltransferase
MTLTGWRESGDLRTSRAGLVLALLAAALLRFWALAQGISFNLGVDEPEIMERAVRMMKTGDLNPHFFDYPTLYMYVQALVAVARFLFGAMDGQWASLAQARTEDFYLWGRAVTAILGTATVWIVYRIGMRWSGRTALLGAALLAVMPMHVRESHYVLTDVPATFLVMLTCLLSLRAHERATLVAFVAAGAAAGLAAATKYNGALAVLMPLLACAMTPSLRPSRALAILATIGGMLGTFLLAAPYTFLDLPHFLNQFARLSSEYKSPAITSEPVWVIYLKHLRIALEWPGSILVLLGMITGLVRVVAGPDRLKWVLVTAFPLVYFKFLSGQNIIYGRYLLPLIPFLSLLAAAFTVWLVTRMHQAKMPQRVRNLVTVGLTLVAIAPPAYTAIGYDANAARTWTNELAYNWIVRELPPGTTIRLEGSLAIKLPAAYKASYAKELRLDGIEAYADTGIQYLVASSQCYGPYLGAPERFPAEYASYQRIFSQTEEIARFKPTADHPGPELLILKVKS